MNINNTDTYTSYTFYFNLKLKDIVMIAVISLVSLLLAHATFAQGEYTVYTYENGNTSSEGFMEEGKPNGYWKTYYPNGNLQSEGMRENFLLDSVWVFYNELGVKTTEIRYSEGKKNGFQKLFKEGVLYEESQYKDDIRVEEILVYHTTGELKSRMPIESGKEHGDGFEYGLDGRVITLLGYKEGFLRKADKVNRFDSGGKKRGSWISFHSNGVLAMEGYYMNDRKNGIFKTFDKRGDLLTLEKYRDGELVVDSEESIILDIRNTYYEDGKLKSVGGYVENVKEGTHRIYDGDGNIQSGELYSKGQRIGEGIIDKNGDYQGFWKLYYVSGELQAEGEFENTKRIGDWIFYHKNEQIEHKAKYLIGLPHGKWTWYFENGKLRREEFFRRGKEDGTVIEYDLEGNVIVQGEYISGLREGEWFLHIGDYTEKGQYIDNERDGEWIYEYENGELSYEGEFVSGLEVGKHRWYHTNGETMMEGKFSSGLRVGTWKKYDEEGIETLDVKYKAGREVKINGKKVSQAEDNEIEL